jgi:hypothetical protein
MELQEKICLKRDDIASLRSELSQVQSELKEAIKEFKLIAPQCTHIYTALYYASIGRISAIEDGRCEICQDWE